MTARGAPPGRESPAEPFVGLDNYSARYAEVFAGRDTEIGTLIGSFRASRFMLLYANSGVGKSSLLRAGVLPKLVEVAEQDVEEGDPPRYVPAINSAWDGDAVARVRQAVVDAVKHEPYGWADADAEIPHGALEEIVDAVTAKLDSTLLLVFDQFEEYFLHQNEDSRAAFARAVGACVNRPDLRVNLLVSIREDAYARLGSLFKGAVPNVYGSYLNLAPLDVERAGAAICKPLRVFGAEIEPDLVQRVLRGVAHSDDALGGNGNGNGNGGGAHYVATPYLQLVMRELWEHETATNDRGGKLLRLETLEDLRGTEQIIRTHVSKAIADLDEEQKEVAADALRYLAPSDRGKLTLTAGRLAAFTGRREEELVPVLEHLLDKRVVSTAGEDGYEIFHDVLAAHIIEWRTAYERERQTARERCEREKRVAAERREQQEREAKERQERNAKRFRRLSFALVVVAATAIALILWSQAQDQRDRSQSRKLSADALGYPPIELSSLYALEAYRLWPTDEARSAILRLADNHELGPPLPGTERITGVAMSPAGGILATATDGLTVDSGRYNGSIQLWNAATHRRLGPPLNPHAGAINGVAFSPDGGMLASAGADGDVLLWSVATHRRVARLPGLEGAPINAVAFSPDGRLLSSSSCRREFHQATTDNTITLWDLQRGRLLTRLKGSPAPVCTTAFSPDGTRLASGGDDGLVRLWSVPLGRQIGKPLDGHTALAVNELRFSPSGRQLASASSDKTIHVWDVAGHAKPHKLTGHAGVVTSLAFSPDGETLASVARDRSLRLWDVKETFKEIGRPFLGHSAGISSVAYRDKNTVVTGGRDGVRMWAVRGTRELASPIAADPAGVANVAFSPDGRTLAWNGLGGEVGLWDLVHRRETARFTAPTDNVNSLAFSPDGTKIAWAADSLKRPVAPIQGYDVVHRRRLSLTPAPPGGAKFTPHKIRGLAWSPDGTTIAYDEIDATDETDEHGVVRLWDVVHGRFARRAVVAHGQEMHGLDFSPDGKTLAIAGDTRTVMLWDVRKQRVVGRLRGHTELIYGLDFSPDGKRVASASRDGSVILWDVGERRQIGVPMFLRTTLYSVAFSSDGKTLVGAADDGSLQLWDVATHRPIGGPVEGHSSTVFGAKFSPDRRTIASASYDGTIRVWRNYSLGWAMHRLCTYVDNRHAEKTWKQVEPSVGFRDPC